MASQTGSPPARTMRPREVEPHALADVAIRLGVEAPVAAATVRVSGVTHDSRSVQPGDLYAALPGARAHGADFVAEARRRGAVAVLTDPTGAAAASAGEVPVLVVPDPRHALGALAAWIYGSPGEALATVGITGTNGKTTTAYLVEAALRGGGRRTGLLGTIETRVGDTRLASARTTPEAPDLQALLAVMRESAVDAVAMEVSSHALVLGRVDGLVFDVAVFTNLSRDHLDFHPTLEDYFLAKASLFTPERARRGVVNVDDPYGARLAGSAPIPITTVSVEGAEQADWRVVEQHVDAGDGTVRFTLAGPDGARIPVRTPLPGSFNVVNTALAVAACLHVGLTREQITAGLGGFGGVPGRMERVTAGGADEPLALVDYAHTPAALDTVLAALRSATTGRLVAVVGAGGDRDAGKRAEMGAAAARHADLVVVTDDNPRSEDPATIRAAVLAGAREQALDRPAEVVEVADRGAAIRAAVRDAGRGDVIVVAGKGHEQGQEVAGHVLPFDDRLVLAEALAERAPRPHADEPSMDKELP